MYTIAFVGPSGTGKSFRSAAVASSAGAEAIIDDGLLISKNKVLAGFSAKKEATKIAAVKRALFTKESHVNEVKKAISDNKINRIMILGTSIKMAEKIAAQLALDPIDKIIRIEDVATPEEMREAKRMRLKEGKHVIPVPVPEIKRDFSGYFLHPLRQIKKKKSRPQVYEKSIIRPTFSYMGDYTVSNSVICAIASHEAAAADGIEKINSVYAETDSTGASIYISLTMKYGTIISTAAHAVQKAVAESIDYHTSVNINKIDIYIKKLLP